jgi:hypothetical protein
VTFYVEKALANGAIRFGVSPRRPEGEIDTDPAFSTAPAGDFARRGVQGFYFADTRNVGDPKLPTAPSITTTPFLQSLRPDGTLRGYGLLALMILGALFVLLGLMVVAKLGKQGWIEVVLGIIFIAIPLVMTAQRRKAIREQEEKERVEREKVETRNRELLAAYTASLRELRTNPGAASVERVRRERAALDLPYELWSPLAKQTVLQLGFDALARVARGGEAEVGRTMKDAALAAGLTPEDELLARRNLYAIVFWHLLADDRLAAPQQAHADELRRGLQLSESDTAEETKAADEFRRLRGVTSAELPRVQATIALKVHELCALSTAGTLMKSRIETVRDPNGVKRRVQRWVKNADTMLTLTNRRLILGGKKKRELEVPKIDEVVVTADTNLVHIRTSDPKNPIVLQVPDPIYSAALIELAAAGNHRPRFV